MQNGRGECPGSFGELLQGVLPDDQKFLVHLKIKDSSRANIKIFRQKSDKEKREECPGIFLNALDVFKNQNRQYSGKDHHGFKNIRDDTDCWKSRCVVKNAIEYLKLNCDFNLTVQSDLPAAKGLSSSTADMVASLRALSHAVNINFLETEISGFLSRIEPNDGLHVEGSIAYNYITGEVLYRNLHMPHLKIVGIDTGGTVDTIEFNRKKIYFSSHEKRIYEDLHKKLQRALFECDSGTICEISTMSSVLWQKILPKPDFVRIMEFSNSQGGLGLINCHSGSYLGIAFDPARDLEGVLQDAKGQFGLYDASVFETAFRCGDDENISAGIVSQAV